MVEKLNLKDDTILAVKVDGKVDLDDAQMVMANLKSELKTPGHIKGYVEIHNLEGIGPTALMERLKFGISYFTELTEKVDKIALVTEEKWFKRIAEAIFKVRPGIKLEGFAHNESDRAKAWLKEA